MSLNRNHHPGESFTFINNNSTDVVQLGADTTEKKNHQKNDSILSTKEIGLNNGFKKPKCTGLALRNDSL